MSAPADDLDGLIAFHKPDCNRYTNGRCMTRRCLVRGGYKAEPRSPADFDEVLKLATCEIHETICALQRLQELEASPWAMNDERGVPYDPVTGKIWPSFLPCVADAHLIAAAPELYAAVDAALGIVDGRGPPSWDLLRAVLSKARGERR